MILKVIAATASGWPQAVAREEARVALAARGVRPRRMNRFAEIALAGALETCPPGQQTAAGSGVYLATRHGDARDTRHTVGDIQRERVLPMPVAFINLSGNMAGYHIAAALGVRGPNVSVSDERNPFLAALELAALDLESGAVPCALVGHVEERDDVAVSHWIMLASADAGGVLLTRQPRQIDASADDIAARIAGFFADPRGELLFGSAHAAWRLHAG